MAGSCAKNGGHSACKNCTDMDSTGWKEKGASTNNMEENDTGRGEECWYWLEECHRISPTQGNQEEPCSTMV